MSASEKATDTGGHITTLACMILISGYCSLIFQVAWLREFQLLFGARTESTAVVLAVFMGGIGFGGIYIGREFDAYTLKLKAYFWLEIAVAFCVALTPIAIDVSRYF